MRGIFFACVLMVACGTSGGTNDGGTTDSGTSDSGTSDSASSDGNLPPPPNGVCDVPAKPVDTSKPTTVVTDCSSDAQLRAAAATGGVVTFSCGAATITVTSEIPVAKDTTIDGGGKITLSGGGKSRILHITSAWNVSTPLLTVQNLAFQDGFTTAGGGAIFEDGGSLTVIASTFTNNKAAIVGQDVAGGAINGLGVGTLIIVGSRPATAETPATAATAAASRTTARTSRSRSAATRSRETRPTRRAARYSV